MAKPKQSIAGKITCEFLANLGCKKSRKNPYLYYLDGFSHNCYLVFDASDCPEYPEHNGTVNLFVAKPGSLPHDTADHILVGMNFSESQVRRFMFAMGVNQFSDKTKTWLYKSSNPLREVV